MSSSSGYDFSQLYHATSLAFSPGTTFTATAYQNRIIVRSSTTLSVVRTWICVSPASHSSLSPTRVGETVDQLYWSSDSLYLLAFSSKSSSAWVFALTEDGDGEGGELARIGGDGVEGLVRVEWGKLGREVLAWSDYGLRLTIYDLSTGNARYIQHPKSSYFSHTHSPGGRYLAVAERHNGKDCIGVYDVPAKYALVRHFTLRTTDVQGILWSPCGKYIAAWDTPLSYSLHVHSPLGPHLTHFSPSSPTFSLNADPGLGIRTLTWAPGGRWIALGGYDGRVRIVESEGWICVATIVFGVKTTEKDVAIWREPDDWLRETRGHGIVHFDRLPLPASLPTIRPDLSRSALRARISQISFDPEAIFFLVRTEQQPNIVHIHTFLPSPVTHLAALIFLSPVKSARWCPKGKRVAISTRTGAVHIWDGEGGWVEDGEEVRGGIMEGIGVPSRTDFAVHDTHWSPDGTALAVRDKTHFCMLYEAESAGASRRREAVEEGLSHVLEEDEDMSFGSESVGRAMVLA